ncbi:MAG: NAD-dependent epimerase/dehydratase family protein [Acidimicrobiia bacterium]
MFTGRVAVVGAGGPVVAAFLARGIESVGAERLVVVDSVAPTAPTTEFRHASGPAAIAGAITGCDTVVYFGLDAPCGPDTATRAGASPEAPDIVDAVSAALAARSTPTRLVVVSSAQTYGAWANNPVPLTEAAPLRPNEDAPDAARLAEIERRLRPRADSAGPDVAVLRAATVLGPGVWAESCAALLDAGRVGPVGGRPVRQFVHVDDLAAAAWHCLEFGLSGVYNVASDGWLTPEEVDAMARRRAPSVRLRPDEYRRWLELRRPGSQKVGAAELARHMYPCVVATTRIAASGFRPAHTNAEVLGSGLDAAARWHTQVRRARRAARAPIGVGAAVVVGALWAARRRH